MPKVLIVLAALIGATFVGTGQSLAYNDGRWCAFVGMGSGNIREICHFNDFNACLAEVVAGDRGHCGPNPYWTGSSQGSSHRRRGR